MLLIRPGDLNGALPVIDSYPGDPENPAWMLDQDGVPKRLSLWRVRQRVFLEAYTLKASAPTSVEQVKMRRFAEIDKVSELLKETMREKLACALAAVVEAAGLAGDFKILSHSRSWNPDLSKEETRMELTISVAMCGCFMDGTFQREWDVWPSPKRIFSKIRNARLAARISEEMMVQDVMFG